jgi:hypothetical protein
VRLRRGYSPLGEIDREYLRANLVTRYLTASLRGGPMFPRRPSRLRASARTRRHGSVRVRARYRPRKSA